MAGAPVGEIDATLLTFKTRSDRPVWSEQFREPAVAGRPLAVLTSGRQFARKRPLCYQRFGNRRDVWKTRKISTASLFTRYGTM